MNKIDRRELKTFAKSAVKRPGSGAIRVTVIYLIAVLVLVGINVASGLILDNTSAADAAYISETLSATARNEIVDYAVQVVTSCLVLLLNAGFIGCVLFLYDGASINARDLLGGMSIWYRVIILDILRGFLIVLQSVLLSFIPSIILGFLIPSIDYIYTTEFTIIATVIMAVIVLLVSYRYRLVFFVLMDDMALTAGQALRKGKKLMRKHCVELFLLDLSFIPLFLLCILTCGILLIWKYSYIETTYAAFYRKLLEEAEATEKANPTAIRL